MLSDNWRPISDQVVRHLAGRGQGEIDRLRDLVDRAQALLARGDLTEADSTSYWWELNRALSDEPSRTWFASISNSATGEGLTRQIYVAKASNEASFRRLLSWEFSREIAHQIAVGCGADKLSDIAPEALSLIAPSLRERIARVDRGEDRPAAFEVSIRLHANYS